MAPHNQKGPTHLRVCMTAAAATAQRTVFALRDGVKLAFQRWGTGNTKFALALRESFP